MWPIAADVTHIATDVCLCVGHMGELCTNGSTDPDVIWWLTHVRPRNHVAQILHNKGHFLVVTRRRCCLLPNYFEHLFLFALFMNSHTDGPIWTMFTSCDALLHKEMTFGGRDLTAVQLGVIALENH